MRPVPQIHAVDQNTDHSSRFEFPDLNDRIKQAENIPADSISFKVNETLYTKSNALIKIVSRLGLLGQFAYIFKIIPESFRDHIYDRIAMHRNKFFRASACKNNCLSDRPHPDATASGGQANE